MSLEVYSEVDSTLFLHDHLDSYFNEEGLPAAEQKRLECALLATRTYLFDLMLNGVRKENLGPAGVNQFAVEMDRQQFPPIKLSYAEEKVQEMVANLLT